MSTAHPEDVAARQAELDESLHDEDTCERRPA
jgi:hypothetical protein